jgi:general secretion pathway protein B
MSYILEALKKAQAERQLGNAPTIHTPQALPPGPAAGTAGRKPLLVGLGAGALVVVAAGAVFLWRQAPAPAPRAATQASAVPAAAPARAPATLEVSAPPAPPAPARMPEPPPAPAPAREVAAARPEPETRPAPPRPAPAQSAEPRAEPRAASQGASAAAAAPAPAPEDSLPFLQQLPEAQQRDVPRVTFGGYMYSSNPADRLLIVDKALRHEGEEVAPGLVLEKLLPKAAVMNYRGTRYRVAY